MPQVIINMYDPEGDPLKDIKLDSMYTSYLDYTPFPSKFKKVSPGKVICEVSTESPFSINLLWEAQGFGEVILKADNAGQGFRASPGDIPLTIELNYELARSRGFDLIRRYRNYIEDNCGFSEEITNLKEKAEVALNKTSQLFKDGDKEWIKMAGETLRLSLWTSEKLDIERAKANITRQGRRPGFLFGANTFGYYKGDSAAYREKFEELLNFGTVPFYWGDFEPEEGKPRWEMPDKIVKWLLSKGIKAKGHPLLWFFEDTTPKWQLDKDFTSLKRIVYKHVYDIVDRYKGSIDIWDVINEPHSWANCLNFEHSQMIEIIRMGMDAAKDANPEAIRLVNNCILWGEYVAQRRTHQGSTERQDLATPYRFLKMLEEAGIEYEVIGLQLYYPSRDMAQISDLLDRFAQFGKPIHITELGVPSEWKHDPHSWFEGEDNVKRMGYWHKPWDEETQADWVEQFYTICFSKPYIEAVTWWDLADYDGHFFPHGGFLRKDISEKLSYKRLKNLIDSWS